MIPDKMFRTYCCDVEVIATLFFRIDVEVVISAIADLEFSYPR
jgi:hypothetical protein